MIFSSFTRLSYYFLDGSYWARLGKEDLLKAINTKVNNGVAKNVIFFVGDGMGVPTHTMARIYKVSFDFSN